MAYEVRLVHTCAQPLLAHVDCAVVLTMRGSGRQWDARLNALAAKTFVQINAGYESGVKPAWVCDSASDIVHAYLHACETFGNAGHVLIFEDDAQLMTSPTSPARADWHAVDVFLEHASFDLYSLGCFGAMMPSAVHSGNHYRLLTEITGVPQFSMAQAVVWSPRARELLRSADGRSIRHIDGHFMAQLPLVYTYHRPLVVQTFPSTNNQAQWCVLCKREYAGVDRMIMRAFTTYLRALGLDRRTKGWDTVYDINKLLPVVYLVCISVAAVSISQRVV